MCCPRLCMFWVCVRLGVLPLPPQPTPFPTRCPLCLPVLPFFSVPVSPVSISTSTVTVLLLSLPPFLIRVLTTATDILLLSEVYSLVAHSTVIYIVDVFLSHMSTERWVLARTVTKEIPFGVEFDAYLSTVCSLWEHVAISVFWA